MEDGLGGSENRAKINSVLACFKGSFERKSIPAAFLG
jgi:hypothetical protein